MLIKSLKGLFAGAALGLIGACSTPGDILSDPLCEAPGRLCAPIVANTSDTPTRPLAVPRAAAAPAPQVSTQPVESPHSAAVAVPGAPPPTRIGLLLPLRSEALGAPADALRAGFMAAWERDRDGFVVNLIETGDGAQETLDAYAAALARNDIVVGPLARSAVGAVAASGKVAKPTIALNHPDVRADMALPNKLLLMGLSIEDEARQVAQWAGAEHPGANALIISGPTAWQRRIANAFAAHWKQLGNPSQVVELEASNGYLSESGIGQLKTRVEVEAEPFALLFTALDADQLRQVRSALGPDLPAYGTSSVNPGSEPGTALAELDGLRLLDLPWAVQPDHPAVMVYPRWSGRVNGSARTLDLDRLYALGIDAFRVAREIMRRPGTAFQLDGVTGRLSVSFGKGLPRFERIQPGAVYQAGRFQPIDARR